jgi:hypothetical protein
MTAGLCDIGGVDQGAVYFERPRKYVLLSRSDGNQTWEHEGDGEAHAGHKVNKQVRTENRSRGFWRGTAW